VPEEPAQLILRVTRRCLLEDLEFGEPDFVAPLEELAQRRPIIRAFLTQRRERPVGQETIQGLTSKIVAYSLHAGEVRGLTWHHETGGVVWLLAARFHRSGKADDAYPYFRTLDAKARLLPTRDDLQALAQEQTNTLARSLLSDVRRLRREAESQPENVIRGEVGGRIRVRLCYEAGDRPMLTLAISRRIIPGEMLVPPDWLMTVAGAFFPELPVERLAVVS
jgi:hypothetical protein